MKIESSTVIGSKRLDELNLPQPIRLYVDALNSGDFELLLSQFTPDAVIHGVLGSAPVPEAAQIWRELHDGMALQLTPQAVALDGPSVVVRFLESGCFRGKFRGYPGREPTGRTYEVTAIEWFELAGDRIRQRWGARDSAAISRQIL